MNMAIIDETGYLGIPYEALLIFIIISGAFSGLIVAFFMWRVEDRPQFPVVFRVSMLTIPLGWVGLAIGANLVGNVRTTDAVINIAISILISLAFCVQILSSIVAFLRKQKEQ